MKLVILLSVVAISSCAHLGHFDHQHGRQLAEGEQLKNNQPEGVITDDREAAIGPVFKYLLETVDGIKIQQEGAEGPNGTSIIRGSYSYISPEGETIEVTYVADETGFHPESPILPVGPEIPPHARAQIEAAAAATGRQFFHN